MSYNQNPNLEEMLKLLNCKNPSDNLLNSLKSKLNDEQKAEVQNIMSDKERIEKLLSSPQAKEILKRLNKFK